MPIRRVEVRREGVARVLGLGELLGDGPQDAVPRLDGLEEMAHSLLVDVTAAVVARVRRVLADWAGLGSGERRVGVWDWTDNSWI